MSNLFKQTGKVLGFLGGGLTLITYAQGVQREKENKQIMAKLEERVEIQNSIINDYKAEIQREADSSKMVSKVLDINETNESTIREGQKLVEISNKINSPDLDASQLEMLKTDFSHHTNNIVKDLSKGTDKLVELEKMLKDYFSKDKFIDSNLLEDFQNYISTLPLEKVGALGHILISFAILLSLLSIISIFYGDSLIVHFKLEDRFPRIARFIQIRRKFQQYYFSINIIAIVIALLLVIYINSLVFLN